MSLIHPTAEVDPRALVDPSARLGAGVKVGPFSIIGPEVVIGEGSEIGPHVVIKGPTSIGRNNKIYQFASVGEDCQDLKYKGEPTRLEMGDNNIVRESATIHRGTIQDQGVTKIGNNNLFMAYTHVAHDCVIGNHCIMANAATLAGHVHLGDYAILGGLVAVHQFTRIGAHAMCGGGSLIPKDVPAYVLVDGQPAKTYGLNYEGLKRRGFSKEALQDLRRAFKLVFRSKKSLQEAISELEAGKVSAELSVFIESLRNSARGLTR